VVSEVNKLDNYVTKTVVLIKDDTLTLGYLLRQGNELMVLC